MACPEYEDYYAIIRRIPRGRVLTYGDVALWAGRPGDARRVGYALSSLDDPAVPWWRVINARGEVSARGCGAEVEQRGLLVREGVRFGEEGRVDLERFRHRPGRRRR